MAKVTLTTNAGFDVLLGNCTAADNPDNSAADIPDKIKSLMIIQDDLIAHSTDNSGVIDLSDINDPYYQLNSNTIHYDLSDPSEPKRK